MTPNLEKAHAAPRCEHILFDNQRCTQPALQGRRGCRFHFGLGDIRAPFPIIEDGLSLQVALNQIARAILDGSLERKTATTLLYCFQIMSSNLKQMNAERKLSQKKDEDDDLPGPSLAEILLDSLKELEIDPEDDEDTAPDRSTGVPPVTRAPESSANFVPDEALLETPIEALTGAPIDRAADGAVEASVDEPVEAPGFSPAAKASPEKRFSAGDLRHDTLAETNTRIGVIDKLEACSQSKIKNRKSKMPFVPPRPPASPAVNEGVIHKLEACSQSSLDNRKSKMSFVLKPHASTLKPDTSRLRPPC